MKPRLRFPENKIQDIASRYEYQLSEEELTALRPNVLERGHLIKPELQKITYWKAPRSSGHTAKNPDDYVVEITSFAFSAKFERSRIEILTLLYGVSWPTASVILHFFHPDPYPIIDYRALWSMRLEAPSYYHFDFWWTYVEFCRKLASRNGIDMRTLDRALWQYSKENQ